MPPSGASRAMPPGPGVPTTPAGVSPVHQQMADPQASGNEALGCPIASVVGDPPSSGTLKTFPTVDCTNGLLQHGTMRFDPTTAIRPLFAVDEVTVPLTRRTSPPLTGTLFVPSPSMK